MLFISMGKEPQSFLTIIGYVVFYTSTVTKKEECMIQGQKEDRA